MKILFLSHRIPYPPDKGEKIRAFHILKYLSASHDVYLASLYDDKEDKKYISEVGRYCKESHLFYLDPLAAKVRGAISMLKNMPISLGYFYLNRLKLKIDELIGREKFDAIFVYSSSMAQYVLDKKNVNKVMDFVDCDSAKWGQYADCENFPMSWIYRKESKALERYEDAIVKAFDRCIVTTERELKEFGRFTDLSKFSAMPNGVDKDLFRPVIGGQRKGIVFTGQMDYFANVDGVINFCREILPIIRDKVPGVEFYIVGRKPVKAVRKLTEINNVFVTGSVNDIKDYLNRASVCVVPLRIAQGVQNKILEAMASGLPVVTTPKALAGLKAEAGKDIGVADGADEFAAEVIRLLKDEAARRDMGEHARRYVEENHDWQKNLSQLGALIIGGRGR